MIWLASRINRWALRRVCNAYSLHKDLQTLIDSMSMSDIITNVMGNKPVVRLDWVPDTERLDRIREAVSVENPLLRLLRQHQKLSGHSGGEVISAPLSYKEEASRKLDPADISVCGHCGRDAPPTEVGYKGTTIHYGCLCSAKRRDAGARTSALDVKEEKK